MLAVQGPERMGLPSALADQLWSRWAGGDERVGYWACVMSQLFSWGQKC
jgi:hypothetical protein